MSGAPGARVRVQSSRHGHELIVDETFASFRPHAGAATFCVWDALAAPALLLAPGTRPRVLVLGLGGGSAAAIVRAIHPDARIVGVEIDRGVLAAARRHLALDALGLEIEVADAREFLRRDRRRYDLVVEDVFVGRGDAVRKPDWIPHPGHDLARRRLRPGGLLVCNTLDEAARVGASLGRDFASLLRIEVRDYDNRVFVASDRALSARALRERLAASPVLRPSLPVLRLRTLGARAGEPGSGS